ncbi:MAG: glycosyltransferase [Muribaculaceae bacterium]|nr:glycosyltransferase [Muribaculaceae bacterium]
MLLSIIIPVYNGAKEIGRCLDSIYSQGADPDSFEVICVDDCSPDPSSVEAVASYRYLNITPPI